MKQDTIELSRRKVLAGLGGVGLASAGAGLGTTAYFSDTESFQDNTIEAGRLNLALDWRGQYNDVDVLGIDPDDTTADGLGIYQVMDGRVGGPIDGAPGLLFSLDDLAPGDKALVEVGFVLDDNPSRLWMRTRSGANLENGYTEPEPTTNTSAGSGTDPAFTGRGRTGDFNDAGVAGGRGELADELELHVSHTDGSYTQAFDASGPASDIDAAATGSYLGSRGDLSAGSTAHVVEVDLAAGRQLQRDPGVPDDVFDPATGVPSTTNAFVTFEFELPRSVENNVQRDSFAFTVDFTTEQARHGGGTTNPFAP